MARKKREPGSPEQPSPPREEWPADAFRGGKPDVPDPRAKNSGHGKKTADKWNQ
jgi:hypothetical protein